MKKQERKDSYTKIMSLMIKGQSKQAFTELACMCGSDTGLFLMIDYDEAVKLNKAKNGEVND